LPREEASDLDEREKKAPCLCVDENSKEFIEHVNDRIASAAKKERRLAADEFARRVRVRRMEKYGF
jgi:hypothetical protein